MDRPCILTRRYQQSREFAELSANAPETHNSGLVQDLSRKHQPYNSRLPGRQRAHRQF
jgi:hypothetical protein